MFNCLSHVLTSTWIQEKYLFLPILPFKENVFPLTRITLKGILICFSMLKSSLCGGYVNFGVFRLYGDMALDDALNTFVKMLLSVPQSDMLVSSFLCLFNLLNNLSKM